MWLTLLAAFKEQSFYTQSVIMLTDKFVVVLTGLDEKFCVRCVGDWDKTESKCVQFWDETETFKKWSWDQSQVLPVSTEESL